MVGYYKEGMSQEKRQAAINEIVTFISDHSNDLDKYFDEIYGFDFNPKLWGYSNTAAFFDELKTLLSE
ncbi:contact-dependent growth inhibition system immunity protein [Neisseriaceae bacterium TC5R-5]|nr:contact-dependent growth inhibition system immunity protein [Neisseriaceae bacterium TC5R-5]